jgi:Ca2+-transporting ATPase
MRRRAPFEAVPEGEDGDRFCGPYHRTVVLLQIVEAHVGRSWTESVFRLNPLTNRALLAGTGAVLLLQGAAMYVPPLPQLFGTAPLAAYQVVVPLIAGCLVLTAVEVAKQIGRPA